MPLDTTPALDSAIGFVITVNEVKVGLQTCFDATASLRSV